MNNTKCVCSASDVSDISCTSNVSNLLSVPMKHNNFISGVSRRIMCNEGYYIVYQVVLGVYQKVSGV